MAIDSIHLHWITQHCFWLLTWLKSSETTLTLSSIGYNTEAFVVGTTWNALHSSSVLFDPNSRLKRSKAEDGLKELRLRTRRSASIGSSSE